jgi:hypothetical protein
MGKDEYNISKSVQSSSAMGSLRAAVSAIIKPKCAVNNDGFEDLSSFWEEVKEEIKLDEEQLTRQQKMMPMQMSGLYLSWYLRPPRLCKR